MKTLQQLYDTYGDIIQKVSDKYKLEPAMVGAMCWVESHGNPKAISSCGAIGLMQVMPKTAKDMGVSLYTPEQQLNAGAKYIRWLKDHYTRENAIKTFAAYNAGPGRLRGDKWMRIHESKLYVQKCLQAMIDYQIILDQKRSA